MTETDFEYCYTQPSVAEHRDSQTAFLLSHCSEIAEDRQVPCFFHGRLTDAFLASKCLGVLAKTVRSHFAIAPGARASLRDPIVSVGNGQLHFEAFSSCNSVYARVDILNHGVDGEFIQSGCTNVDFNDATVRAFHAVARNERVTLGIGSKDVKINTAATQVTEKKVSLPNRWIKGLGNVQVYLSNMKPLFTLTRAEMLQVMKSLPKAPVKDDYYLFKSGNAFRCSPLPSPQALRIGGAHRLQLMESLLPFMHHMVFYQSDDDQSVAVVLEADTVRMLFLLSDSVYRGFSGEGKNLLNLAETVPPEWVVAMNNYFKTNEAFDPTLVAIEHDVSFGTMDALQASLSVMGLLGFDLNNQHHFYRRLPFKMTRLRSFSPRLENARKLLTQDEVHILQHDQNMIRAHVKGSGDIVHTVMVHHQQFQCTCPWFTSHQTNRGLCKHILAVKMKLSNEEEIL